MYLKCIYKLGNILINFIDVFISQKRLPVHYFINYEMIVKYYLFGFQLQ